MAEESTPYVLKMRNTTASAPPKPKHEWIVIVPDHEDVLDKRMDAGQISYTSHNGKVLTNIEFQLPSEEPDTQGRGWLLDDGSNAHAFRSPCILGAILSEPISDPQKPQMTGSVMLAVAESKEDVVQQLKEDIYFKSGVWDWDRVQIHPVSSGLFLFSMCS
ncbi:MAG: hypothetical protein Q9195_001927 [Heterodermia aff. obscurata]